MVLDMDRGDPRRLEGAHRAPDVAGLEEPALGICHHRHSDRIGDPLRPPDQVVEPQHAHIRQPQIGSGGGIAADIADLEPRLGDDHRAQRIVAAGHDDGVAPLEQRLQGLPPGGR